MIERGKGSILATGSLSSQRGMPMGLGYVVSKHAILGLIRTIESETARNNVRANCLLPGLIRTPLLETSASKFCDGDIEAGMEVFTRMVPQGRLGKPEEIAEIAAFLMSDASSYINGQTFVADGGILSTIGNIG